MKNIIKFLIIIGAVLSLSCNDKIVDDQLLTDDFVLKINVKDNDDNPVPNLIVSAWNKILYDNYLMPKIQKTEGTQSSSTTFLFTLKAKSHVNLIAYDLENTIYDSIINGKLNPGNYQIIWQNSKINRVYKVIFEVVADSLIDSLNFRDSIYAVNHSIDPQVAAIGQTDLRGEFENKNKMLFPSLYDLPKLNRTGFDGPEIIGTFTFLDTIVIGLRNATTNKMQYYDYLLKDGENKVSLIWNPTFSKSFDLNRGIFKINTTSLFDSIEPIGIPMKNDFRQNYPNPYN